MDTHTMPHTQRVHIQFTVFSRSPELDGEVGPLLVGGAGRAGSPKVSTNRNNCGLRKFRQNQVAPPAPPRLPSKHTPSAKCWG